MISTRTSLDRLRELRDWAIENPEKHDQSRWMSRCGTTFCAAGYAVKKWGEGAPSGPHDYGGYSGYSGEDFYEEGKDLLGLNKDEADLFFVDNDDFHYFIQELIRSRAADLEEVASDC